MEIESIWGWLNRAIEIKENKSVKILMTALNDKLQGGLKIDLLGHTFELF